jgi:glycosyltransferase involved in cell wall biosynthesis
MKKEIGVNVIGFINGEFGLGEAIRLLIKAMKKADIPVALLNYDVHTYHQHNDSSYTDFTTEAPYPINLVLLGPSEASKVITFFPDVELFKNKYNIYYLNWESEYFPPDYVENIKLYDEIWVPSNYCKDVISKLVDKPVTVVHYPIEIETIEDEESKSFYDTSAFNFLFMFDYNSTLERKNTLNLIDAFEKAFGKNDKSVCLTIKTSKSTRFQKDKEKLMNKINGFENIKIVEKIFEKNTLHNIIKGCDSYISLHRSEGFGLTMAEAMFFAKPTIGTGYSGNLEFMTNENSFLVDYEMAKAGVDYANYDKNTIWSEPNVDHAATLLKKIKENSNSVSKIALKGQATIKDDFSSQKIGNYIKNRLQTILSTFEINPMKNELISYFIKNEKLEREMYIVNKSKLMRSILDIKLYFRNRKKK